MTGKKYKLLSILIILSIGLIPAFLAQFLTREPANRKIHITSFRYGKDPSVIRCNRGDTLHLTFSTEDTGHSFFLEEFDVDIKVSPGRDEVAVFSTSDPTRKPAVEEEVTLIARHPGFLNYIVSKSNFRCHVWCGPMHAFEQGKLIILPNTLLIFALFTLAGIALVWYAGLRMSPVTKMADEENLRRDLLSGNRFFTSLVRSRWPQLIITLLAMLMIYIVILTSLFGTKVSGRNLGVLLMWTIWLFILVAVLTPFGGRLWCSICPLPFFGDFIQRRSFLSPIKGRTGEYYNRFSGFFRKWPASLGNDWIKTIVFMILATFSTVMVAVPKVSGLAVVILILAPTLMAVFWEHRAFCRYVCPVSVFVNPFSRMGILSLRKKSGEVCNQCTQHFCLTGSPKGWACPYGINVSGLNGNSDCGLCLECTRSCPYNNVSLFYRPFAHELGTRTISEAWMTFAIFTISIIYSIVYLGPWPVLREYVNIIDKDNWNLFGLYIIIIWLSALVVIPGIFYLMVSAGTRVSGTGISSKDSFLASAGSLLPLGLTIWISFVIPMFFVNITFIKQSLSDPFGWGWDFFGTANIPWHQFIPEFIPWIQALLILTGYFLSLRNLRRTWNIVRENRRGFYLVTLPSVIFLTAVAVTMLIFFTS